ncbi:MAG TPA: AbrB/MazE/SpoVT family DNA-binding domain-containing protein [Bacteroidales bacterium]|nr:AbrB/MazE/SpoVT family DNA-binding domain-containing protein [Bacteroidales bacterium]
MARRIFEEEHIRSLAKGAGGSSYSVILPKHLIRELGWKEKQKLDVRRYGDGILIKDWDPDEEADD